MREQVVLTGMVIKSAPAGEYDRRLVILTCERGKITAFARGARRPGSTLMASSAPFVFGTFSLYEGRDAYSLVSVEVQNYFREITENMEAACYGSYFGVRGLLREREPGGSRDLKTSLPVTPGTLKEHDPEPAREGCL